MADTVRFDWESSEFAIVIEDDARAVVAYLLKAETIVSDVWLFNRGATPERPEWQDCKQGPFKNAAKFVTHTLVTPAFRSIVPRWLGNDRDLQFVELLADGNLLAALSPGSTPGWCANAAVNGPIARPLEDYIAQRTGH
jgi:hypothetical protein